MKLLCLSDGKYKTFKLTMHTLDGKSIVGGFIDFKSIFMTGKHSTKLQS